MTKLLLFIFLFFPSEKIKKLKPISSVNLRIAEPSGICVTDDHHYFVASNNGVFCEIDKNGNLLRSEKLGMDIEDVCAVGNDLFVMDETLRLVYVLDAKTWKQKASHHINFNGAANKGLESITYIPEKRHFIIVTEKLPILIMETDENFLVLNQFQLNDVSDISSATYFNNKLWLLSDEDHTVLKMNPDDFSIEKKFSISVYNPEGISFDADGTMRIVSDDMHRLFIFSNPDKQ